MGALCWRDFAAWPGAGGTLFTGGTGRAAIDGRDGTLTQDAPAGDGVETLVHDPWRPAPSVPAGQERTLVDARPDVLTFTTPPASAVTLFAGTVAAELDIAADASEFDIACTLSRVGRDGRVFAVADGYRRVTEPGPVRLPMRATCLTLQPGEALRLSVAAAAFPAFPVNPGTGEDPTRARAVDARIIMLHLRHGARLTIRA